MTTRELLSGLKGEIQNALGESFVTQSSLHCRLGKLVVAVEIWIRVRFQNHHFIVRCQTQIDAAIAADAQRAIRCSIPSGKGWAKMFLMPQRLR